jgi:hypothetical protein
VKKHPHYFALRPAKSVTHTREGGIEVRFNTDVFSLITLITLISVSDEKASKNNIEHRKSVNFNPVNGSRVEALSLEQKMGAKWPPSESPLRRQAAFLSLS